MSEVRFIVRDARRTVSSTWHGSSADAAVAALSSDPETIEELEVAIERFMKPWGDGGWFRCFGGSLNEEPYDAGLVVIDLAARLVVVESTYSSPGMHGAVWYHDGSCCTDVRIPYQLADEWRVTSDVWVWRSLAEARRREREARPPLDARAVLSGRPLVEFIASECFAAFARRDEIVEATRQKWIARKKERAVRWPELVAKEEPIPRDPETMTLEELAWSTSPGQERYASPFYDGLKDIHVEWLMTPRDDLRGEIPREVLLAQRDHIAMDLESRCQQWSRLDFCPRGLDTTSHAFRFGGFGTHELVMYYHLVRELLWSCWERLTELAESGTDSHSRSREISDRTGQRSRSRETSDRTLASSAIGETSDRTLTSSATGMTSDRTLTSSATGRSATWPANLLTLGDFLTAEVPRLEQVRDEWLNMPDPEYDFRTPRSIIDRERQRLPEGVSGAEAIVDPDCPCCQMLADMPGPTFWSLDGSGMDDEFAFSIYYRTRKEWDAEQRDYEEFRRQCDAQDAERRRLGVEHPADGQHSTGSVWASSFSVADSPNVPLGIRLFGIGGHLAELITDLREPPRFPAETPMESRRTRESSIRSLTTSATEVTTGIATDPQPLIDQLNRDFGNLREVLTGADVVLCEALVEPVLDRFVESLDAVAASRPDLIPKCESLTAMLQSFLEPLNVDEPESFSDDGLPY